ncbi:hypothetical protein AVEN_269451-1 [Araneus ventricosus]|uniref:Uncharacterized protein n=1 Tax=Araneus ventricosus TaxID=182803 RepID=A0A4Y2M4P5_ARAVE|nr:hypothetical protein AVEN_269451-1 [Araneus ventricosus]
MCELLCTSTRCGSRCYVFQTNTRLHGCAEECGTCSFKIWPMNRGITSRTFDIGEMLLCEADDNPRGRKRDIATRTVLRHISSHELLKMIQDDVPIDGWDFIKFPSLTQAVERIVNLVTEAYKKIFGPQNRDGFIRATIESIKQTSQFVSKKYYKK